MDRKMIGSAALALVAGAAFARVELATPFSDNMVLQRDRAVPVWGSADPGEKVSVSFAGAAVEATADAKGAWRVSLPAMSASKENRTLTAKGAANEVVVCNVLVGEVWFASGQSNMECPIWGENPRYRDGKGAMMLQMTRRPFIRYAKNPRVWSVEPKKTIDVVWREMTPESAAKDKEFHLSAVAFYYALELYGALEIPIGIIDSSWNGANIDAWTPRTAYASHPALTDVAEYPVAAKWKPEMCRGPINGPIHQPCVLWNGMVDAWAPFAIRGFIWYQGCHNASEAYRYCEKMHALYDGWSAAFENPELKLYFVELAPSMNDWFKLQQAQHKFAAEEKNAACAVTCDCGNQKDPHPNDKEVVAKRLALHALKRDYGFNDIEDSSPVLKDWKVDANGIVTLTFDHADAWYYYNDDNSAPKGFDIAGSDGIFKTAKILNKASNTGILTGRDLQVAADGVTKPCHIRYLAKVPQVGSLYAANTSLPLGSFEIDAGETISTNALISVKPHLQLMGETSVGVVWMTREKADGWVEWSQDGGATWRKSWNQRDGLRVDANDCIHKIVVEGYDPAKPFRYRVRSRAYTSFGPYKVVHSGEEGTHEGGVNAVLPADGTLSFAVFNDVHGELETYPKLLGIKEAAIGLSFTVFNGDIMSHVDDPEGLERGLLGPLAYCAERTQAPMWYLRGNHETRGAYARHLRDHLALQNDRYYGAVTLGRTRFVFLDTGEDKEDGHWAYSGLVDFEGYLAEQTAWLKREIESSAWKDAKFRIVFTHIPPDLRVGDELCRQPLSRIRTLHDVLESADTTLVVGAHLHTHVLRPAGKDHPYAQVAGGGRLSDKGSSRDATLTRCDVLEDRIVIRQFAVDGKVVDQMEVKP